MTTASRLRLSPAAKKDLAGVYRTGCQVWGKRQAKLYSEHLADQLWLLTSNPKLGTRRDLMGKGELRSLPVASHVVFYLVEAKEICIVRILHGRQDPEFSNL